MSDSSTAINHNPEEAVMEREQLRQEIIDAAIEANHMPFSPDPVKNHSYRLTKAVADYEQYLAEVGPPGVGTTPARSMQERVKASMERHKR